MEVGQPVTMEDEEAADVDRDEEGRGGREEMGKARDGRVISKNILKFFIIIFCISHVH